MSSSSTIAPNQTIYIRNLNEKIKKDELKRSLYCLFSAYGKIISIVATKTQSGRGQAFIAFTDIVASTTALRGLQGFTFYGKALEIHYAKTKSDAIAKLDGTYRPAPMKKLGGNTDVTMTSAAAKREREADSDSESEMSE